MTELAAIGFASKVQSRATTAPPGSPATGDRYIVPSGASGAWAAQTNKIATWNGVAWVLTDPVEGMNTRVVDEAVRVEWASSAWRVVDALVGSPLTYDSTSVSVTSSEAATKRLILSSYNETDSSGSAEVLRLFFNKPSAATVNASKAAIGWYDGLNPTPGKAVAWVQCHDYLHSPDTGGNNRHRHFSIEVQDSAQNNQSRFSIPYGYDTTELGFFSANVTVHDQILAVVGAAATNREMRWGGTMSSNLTPDGSHWRWVARADATAESGSQVGSDWRLIPCDDTGAVGTTAIFVKRSNGFVGLLGNASPGQALDVGIATSSGTNAAARVNRGTTSQTASVILATGGNERWAFRMSNDTTDDAHIRNVQQGLDAICIESRATQLNMQLLGSTKAFGGGVGVLGITNCNTPPSTTPSGGGVLYVDAGALKFKGSSGTVTTIAAA